MLHVMYHVSHSTVSCSKYLRVYNCATANIDDIMHGYCLCPGSRLLWFIPCISPRIPDPVPPAKYASVLNASVQNV